MSVRFPTRYLLPGWRRLCFPRGCCCRNSSSWADGDLQEVKLKRISRAMEAYLKRTREYQQLMTKELQDFELGKRHLENMMGREPGTMSQEDIDQAIAYLLPSGLVPEARPVMKHPEIIFRRQKAAEFDETGRPFHFLFYTRFPNFYKVLYDAAQHVERLMRYEDTQRARGIKEPPRKISLEGTRWLSAMEMSQLLMENIREEQYAQFEAALAYLISLPYSYRVETWIMGFRKSLQLQELDSVSVPEIQTDPSSGREFAETTGYHKQCLARVRLYNDGYGKTSIDGEQLDQLWMHNSRVAVLQPFILLERLGQFDIEATTDWDGRQPSHAFHNVRHGRLRVNKVKYRNVVKTSYRHGETARATAVRHGVSKALTAFLPDADVKKLHLSGLLTRDLRVSERGYPGHRGKRNKPRAKKKWRKR